MRNKRICKSNSISESLQENCIGNVNKAVTITLMRMNITESSRLLNVLQRVKIKLGSYVASHAGGWSFYKLIRYDPSSHVWILMTLSKQKFSRWSFNTARYSFSVYPLEIPRYHAYLLKSFSLFTLLWTTAFILKCVNVWPYKSI